MSIRFAGLCGIAFCFAAGAALYPETSNFWTKQEIAAGADKSQIVNRLPKDDRILPPRLIDPSARSTDAQNGFGMLEIGGPVSGTITVRDATGRLVFQLDALRRTTVISKRAARGAPPSKEQGGQTAPKSTVVPMERPPDCDPPASRLVGSALLQLIEECRSSIRIDARRQVGL